MNIDGDDRSVVKDYSLAFSVQHLHEQGLRGSLASAVSLVQVLLPSGSQRVDLGHHHHQLAEFVLKLITARVEFYADCLNLPQVFKSAQLEQLSHPFYTYVFVWL